MEDTRWWLTWRRNKNKDLICSDDITGNDLPWHAVRKARELELKYLRDLGVYEKVDEKEAVAKYGITPVDSKWVETDKAFVEEPCRSEPRGIVELGVGI